MPKVSVIIPTFNCSKYIPEAIESVLRQTYPDFEIIIVDDGSTDNTKDIVENCISNTRSKIYYYYQDNKGPGAARNKGINEAKGEYIAFLDADDVWLPKKLEMQMQLFEKKSDIGIVFSDFVYFGEHSKYLTGFQHHKNIIRNIGIYEVYEKAKIIKKNAFFNILEEQFIPTPAIIVRKDCFTSEGFFDESLMIGEDWQMWLRLAKRYNFAFIDEPLVKIRILLQSLSRGRDGEEIRYSLKILNELNKWVPALSFREKSLIKKRTSGFNFDLGYLSFSRNMLAPARKYFLKSLKYGIPWKSILYLIATFLPLYLIKNLKLFKQKFSKRRSGSNKHRSTKGKP